MTFAELEAIAMDLGAIILYGDIPAAAVCLPRNGGPIIFMPAQDVKWPKAFMLAHELGHLVLGHLEIGGYNNGIKPNIVMEIEANHWAREALAGRSTRLGKAALTA